MQCVSASAPVAAGSENSNVQISGVSEEYLAARSWGLQGGENFTDADVRLLETLTGSLAVALENARLFDETQRLLKETEARNAELAIINSVQASLAAKLDMQAIYDAVGDKIQEIFDAQTVGIFINDKANNIMHFPYVLEKGQRYNIESRAPSGISGLIFKTGQTI